MRTTLKRLAVITPVALLLTVVGITPALAAATTITGQATPTTATVGTTLTISDTATLTGAAGVPTGTVTFGLFDNATCTGTPVEGGAGSAITPTTGNSGTSTFSDSWTPTAVGTFSWQASYAGDANNDPATTDCTAVTQQLVVAKATPTLTGEAFPREVIDGEEATLTDVATLAGAHNPTGVIYFALFDNDACDGDPVLEDTAPISGNEATLVVDVTPDGPGDYFWALYYEGDANNEEVESICDDLDQFLMVAPNAADEPQQDGPLTPVLGDGDGAGDVTEQLPATGPAPILELLLLGLGLILVGTSAVGFGRTVRVATA